MAYYDNIVLGDSPVLYIPLSDSSGTTATALVGSDGAYTSSPTLGVAGPNEPVSGSAVSVNGNSGYVTFTTSGLGGTQPQSWEVWVKSPSTISSSFPASFSGPIIGTDGVGHDNFGMLFGAATSGLTNEVFTIAQDGNKTGWSGFTVDTDWHHHCWTFNGTRHSGWSYYLDGVDTGSRIIDGSGAQGYDNLQFRLGAAFDYASGGTRFGPWTGMYGLAVYDSELSVDTIQSHVEAMDNLWAVGSNSPMVMG